MTRRPRPPEFGCLSRDCPSLVAHSFGTYILGNAMLKYDWLRFDKIILCGSILPVDFPWDELIKHGQVQSVRNEYGVQDILVRLVSWFVADTGPSGYRRFSRTHKRLEQEEFLYEHSEYFDTGHMESKWLPFLRKQEIHQGPTKVAVKRPSRTYPIGLYLFYVLLIAALVGLVLMVPSLMDGSTAGEVQGAALQGAIPAASELEDNYPSIDLSRPIEEQVRLFPMDKVKAYGPPSVKSIDVGLDWQPFESGKEYLVHGIPGEPVTPRFQGTGHVKLEITPSSNRHLSRDLRTNEGPISEE